MEGKQKKRIGNGRRKKVAILSSIQSHVMAIVGFPILIAVVAILLVVTLPVRSELKEVNQEFLYMTTVSYGQRLESAVNLTKNHTDIRQTPFRLANFLKNARLKNCESSYCYLVRSDGIMLYHPNLDKIGLPVENAMIKGVVSQMQQGTYPEPEIVYYTFGGEKKVAAYYASSKGFVLVISVDEKDFLATLHHMTAVAVGAGVLIFVIMLLLGYLVARRITRPIETVADVVDKIGELDFTEDERTAALAARKDETGIIANSVENMRRKLVEIIDRIQSQSILLYDTSNNLSQNAQTTSEDARQIEGAVSEIATGASSQAEETAHANDDVAAMGNMIVDTGVRIEDLSGTASQMRRTSEDAFEILGKLGRINEQTASSIQVIYEQTNQTNVSAEKIKEATGLIASIADETNLLSLNASIEAARAGDAGRGFAVVATEISKLATQSNESAQSIDKIIQKLVSDSEKAVETMEELQKIMQQQSEMVANTMTAFKAVREGIDGTLSNADGIQQHAKKLGDARINIVNTVQSLSAIAQQNAANSAVTSDTMGHIMEALNSVADDSAKLNEVARILDESVKEIRI